MFLKCFLINQVQITIPMDSDVPMFVRLKKKHTHTKKNGVDPTLFPNVSLGKRMTKANNITLKVTTKKTIWLLKQWHAMMASFLIFSTLEISVRYTLYINMLTFVSLVVF